MKLSNQTQLILDKVVAIGTFGTKSHVEGVFSDGVWFSISPRDKDGARFKIIEPKDGSWTFVDLPLSIEAEERIRDKCLEKVGTKYDHFGAILSATPICFVRENREWCSRLWTSLLLEEGYPLEQGCKYCPEELYSEIVKINTRV